MVQKSKDDKHGSGFWFGMMMGSTIGTAGLYLLGTKKGRSKLREVIDTFEHLDTNLLEDIQKAAEHSDDTVAKKVFSDIHSVLDKIESSIPSKKEIQKYFVKDGKVLK